MRHSKPATQISIMIFITQLIYIKEGKEDLFHEFERVAIPSIARYNGQLLLRMRPTKDNFIEHNIEPPYEVHLVQFETELDFKNFMHDDERKRFLHLKEASVKSSLMYHGVQL